MVRYLAHIIIFLTYTITGISAQYTLKTLVDKADVWVQWDSARRMGTIWKGKTSVSFKIDSPYLLKDFETIYMIDPLHQDNKGAIIVPPATMSVLQSIYSFRKPFRASFRGVARINTIFIDPGHGGKDPGAESYYTISGVKSRLSEKDIVLQTAKYLAALLSERFPEKKVLISRRKDKYVSLDARTQLANTALLAQEGSMIFISLHVNASLNKSARGFEVWYLPPAVKRKNVLNPKKVKVRDPQVLSILNVIKDEELTIESVLLAQSVLSSLNFYIGSVTPNRGLREESWYIVRNAKMPAILIEIGFISNEQERKRMMDDVYLQKVALAVYHGIQDFIRNVEQK